MLFMSDGFEDSTNLKQRHIGTFGIPKNIVLYMIFVWIMLEKQL